MSRLLYRSRNGLADVAPALLILLLVYAAVAKLAVFDRFRVQLAHQPLPAGVAGVLLYALPLVELLAAVLLVFPKSRFAGLTLSLFLLVLFTGYVALAWLHWWSLPACSCGGVLGHLSWGWHLLFNLFFLALNAMALWFELRIKGAG